MHHLLNTGYRNIILWRHAHALALDDSISTDLERPLSSKGKKQAAKMAYWLKRHLPHDIVIISSQALRATQTADALKRNYTQHLALAPKTSLAAVMNTLNEIALAGNPQQTKIENLLIVGHQPWLGLLAAQLLCLPNKLPANTKEVSMRKGAVWWLERPQANREQLFKILTVQSPGLLG